jgi:hypothetical protein
MYSYNRRCIQTYKINYLTRYTYIYEVQLHLHRKSYTHEYLLGTAAPTRYSCNYEVQQYILINCSCNYEVQLHLKGKLHLRGTTAHTKYSYTYKVQQHL